MKKAFQIIVSVCTLLFSNNALLAQDVVLNENESAHILRQNGQIYLVVLVLATIFAGILFMLFRLEKKINELEKQ